MNSTYVQTPQTNQNKWIKTKVGENAIVYERPLDPQILDKMPSEIDTFVDLNILHLIRIRIRQYLGLSKLK
jgi:hypothetical protein